MKTPTTEALLREIDLLKKERDQAREELLYARADTFDRPDSGGGFSLESKSGRKKVWGRLILHEHKVTIVAVAIVNVLWVLGVVIGRLIHGR